MNYDEACRAIVSHEAAKVEIEKHGHKMEDFERENGNRTEYWGQIVLNWLGY